MVSEPIEMEVLAMPTVYTDSVEPAEPGSWELWLHITSQYHMRRNNAVDTGFITFSRSPHRQEVFRLTFTRTSGD